MVNMPGKMADHDITMKHIYSVHKTEQNLMMNNVRPGNVLKHQSTKREHNACYKTSLHLADSVVVYLSV